MQVFSIHHQQPTCFPLNLHLGSTLYFVTYCPFFFMKLSIINLQKKSLSNFYSPVPFKRLMKCWQADSIARREDQDYLALIPPFSFNLFFLKVTILSPRENCHFLFHHPLSTTAIILMWREVSLILRI